MNIRRHTQNAQAHALVIAEIANAASAQTRNANVRRRAETHDEIETKRPKPPDASVWKMKRLAEKS